MYRCSLLKNGTLLLKNRGQGQRWELTMAM